MPTRSSGDEPLRLRRSLPPLYTQQSFAKSSANARPAPAEAAFAPPEPALGAVLSLLVRFSVCVLVALPAVAAFAAGLVCALLWNGRAA